MGVNFLRWHHCLTLTVETALSCKVIRGKDMTIPCCSDSQRVLWLHHWDFKFFVFAFVLVFFDHIGVGISQK